MPASDKPAAQQTVEQPTTPSAAEEKPFLRFYHATALRTKTLAVLAKVEQAPDPTRHRNALSDIVMELTDSGLEYYFLRPLDLAKAGFVIKQSAHLGMGGVTRVLGPVAHNIIGRLDKEQLIIVCSHIRQLME